MPRLTRARPPWRRGAYQLVFASVAALLLFSGCGLTGAGGGGEGPQVVATLPPLADLVQRVAGERTEVRTLVPEGEDSHTYQPKASDARALVGAEVFFDNGFGLNQPVLDFAAQNLPDDVGYVALGEQTINAEELISGGGGGGDCHGGDANDPGFHCHGGSYNAHLWPNPEFASRYVEVIEQALSQIDPDGSDTYANNAEALLSELDALDEAIQEAVESIPEENRKLVVYHDSWSYFARRYDMQVVGAIQPADFSEPSAAEVRTMVEQIREEGVPAFFGSEVFPSDVLQAVAQESGAEYNADLSDDDLPGDAGDPGHSYIGMMTENVRTIVGALGGDSSALDVVDPDVGNGL